MSINKHKRNLKRVAVVQWVSHEWWLLNETFVSRFYRWILLSNSSFKRLIFTLPEQLNTNLPTDCGFSKHLYRRTWTSESNVNFAMFELTPRLLPTVRAWLLSTHSFCFNGGSIMVKKFQLNGVFWSGNLEKSDQDHFNKWNFAYFRLDMWKMATTSMLVFRNHNRLSLFVSSNTTLLEL